MALLRVVQAWLRIPTLQQLEKGWGWERKSRAKGRGGSKNPGILLQGTVLGRGGSAPSLSFTSTKNTRSSEKAK